MGKIFGVFFFFSAVAVAGWSSADPVLPKQWHLREIGALETWRISKGSPSTLIAVIDSGLDFTNPDLAPNIWRNPREIPGNGIDDDKNGFIDDISGWDFVRGRPGIKDPAGHGTFITGLIAAKADNGVGGAGVCPDCSVMPVRFLNYEGLGDTEDAISGIYYAVKTGARIINLSFAGEGKDNDLLKALKFAASHDVLVVVSAGNDHENIDVGDVYPAKYDLPNLITVGATSKDRDMNYRSNWGRKTVHVGVPGDDIWGPWFKEWDYGDGTSDAAAIMSGAAGLIRTIAPQLTAAELKDIFMATVEPSGKLEEKIISGGVIDVLSAARCAMSKGLPCLAGGKRQSPRSSTTGK